jgi:hypothetical protein
MTYRAGTRSQAVGKWIRLIGGTLLAALATLAPAYGRSLDAALLPSVQANTFEVVVAKPTADPLTYEKPLPLDLLPYQFRHDRYFSIGTAFALGKGRYVTAAHVLNVGIGGLWGAPAIRDAAGKVHSIDKIVKFSSAEDFVVFTLADALDAKGLPVDATPTLNQAVYAVGNALGTGVVIRDGLYTSDTPEEQDGRWKWMRFSAAASPGNSGGPLLDQNGRLIGVVLMKSANENLNYALPIARVLAAPEGVARIDRRQTYQLDVFDARQTGDFKAQFALPLSFDAFSATFLKLANGYADQQLHDLLASNAATLFPAGAGSDPLLYSRAYIDVFPSLIQRNADGHWVLSPQQPKSADLDHNGYLQMAQIGYQSVFHLRRPDDVPADRVYADPKVAMDLQLKASPFSRPVGPEKVRITSLGEPASTSAYVDAYQRRWQVQVWPLAYMDKQLIVFSLPVPDGNVSMMRLVTAGEHVHDSILDLMALADFFYVSYGGTLAQWKDYLRQGKLLPAAFARIHLDFDYGRSFRYRSDRFAMGYDTRLQKVEPGSELTLAFDYFRDHGKVVWDVASALVKADANESQMVRVNRRTKPAAGLDDNFRSNWRHMLHGEHPDDGVVFSDDDVSYIDRIANPPTAHAAEPEVLYTALYGDKGAQPQAAMQQKLDLLLSGIKVSEH